jgi:hypothetical protein
MSVGNFRIVYHHSVIGPAELAAMLSPTAWFNDLVVAFSMEHMQFDEFPALDASQSALLGGQKKC